MGSDWRLCVVVVLVRRMPPQQVSPAMKALVNREEMDAALARIARPGVRIERVDTSRASFLYGSRETMYDTACDFLSPDLRPIPPQPNCAQSMQIYEDHRKMAAEYMHVKTELAKLRQYKADLQEQLARGPVQPQDVQYTQLKSEKEALLAFKEKLSKQLSMIEAAQSSQAGDSRDGWVVVGSTQQGPED